jgi:hypothetical protein
MMEDNPILFMILDSSKREGERERERWIIWT